MTNKPTDEAVERAAKQQDTEIGPGANPDVKCQCEHDRAQHIDGAWCRSCSCPEFTAAESFEDRLGDVDEREWMYVHLDTNGPQLGLLRQGFDDDVRGLTEDEECFGIELTTRSRAQKAERERDEWRKDAEDFSAIDALKAERVRAEAAKADLKEALDILERAIPQLSYAQSRARAAEAREQELREALEGSQDFIERVTKWTGSDPDECHEVLDAIRSALSNKDEG